MFFPRMCYQSCFLSQNMMPILFFTRMCCQ
jgi:hypothetical protein